MTRHGRCGRHHVYDLTCVEFGWLCERSRGRCEHCGVLEIETPHGQLHIDHDAGLGWHAVRGLLCSRCNTTLERGLLEPATAGRYLASPFWREPRVLAGRDERQAIERARQQLLTDLGRHKGQVRTAEQRVARDAAIVTALDAGHRQREVAWAAGLSQSRVQVIART